MITSTPGKGCAASVGFPSAQNAYLNLDEECFSPSAIMHELFHSLGVLHYHQRKDRDKYIIIHWDNIKPEKHSQYCKVSSGDGEKSTYGTEYDFKSFMHYHAVAPAHTLDTNKPTISSKVKFIS